MCAINLSHAALAHRIEDFVGAESVTFGKTEF